MNILLIALSLSFAFNIIECDKKSYQNHTVFRLLPKSVNQVKYLIKLTEEDNVSLLIHLTFINFI